MASGKVWNPADAIETIRDWDSYTYSTHECIQIITWNFLLLLRKKNVYCKYSSCLLQSIYNVKEQKEEKIISSDIS